MTKTRRLLVALFATTVAASAYAYPDKPVTIVVPFAAGGPTDKVGARPCRGAAQGPQQPDRGGRERRRCRWHARRRQGGQGRAGRLHPAAAPHRHGHRAGAVPQDALRHAGRLRIPRHGQRRADDADRQARRCRPTTSPSCASGWTTTRARSTWPTPAWAPLRTCAGCCSSRRCKIDMTTVPYKGTAPAMTDLLGGQVDLMCDQTTNTSSQIEAGKVKAYAVTTAQAADDAGAGASCPRWTRSGLKGFNVVDLARPVRPQGHAQAGARQAQRRAAPGA